MSALIFGGCIGFLLFVCGIRVNNWRFWVLLVAFCATFNAGGAA